MSKEKKTNFILFTHSRVYRNAVVVRLGNKIITQVRSVKFLGIHIDDRLNYNDQTCVLSKKLSRVIVIIFKLLAFVPPCVIGIIYSIKLFYPHLIYGITVWGGCGVSNINKIIIIRLQKRAISLCSNNHSRNSLLLYPSVYSYFTLIRFQKNIHHHHSQYFTDQILALFSDHSHATRFTEANKINIPTFNTSLNHNQFLYNAIKLWNGIPPRFKTRKVSKDFQAQVEGTLFIVCMAFVFFFHLCHPLFLYFFFECIFFIVCTHYQRTFTYRIKFGLIRMVSRVTA